MAFDRHDFVHVILQCSLFCFQFDILLFEALDVFAVLDDIIVNDFLKFGYPCFDRINDSVHLVLMLMEIFVEVIEVMLLLLLEPLDSHRDLLELHHLFADAAVLVVKVLLRLEADVPGLSVHIPGLLDKVSVCALNSIETGLQLVANLECQRMVAFNSDHSITQRVDINAHGVKLLVQMCLKR